MKYILFFFLNLLFVNSELLASYPDGRISELALTNYASKYTTCNGFLLLRNTDNFTRYTNITHYQNDKVFNITLDVDIPAYTSKVFRYRNFEFFDLPNLPEISFYALGDFNNTDDLGFWFRTPFC